MSPVRRGNYSLVQAMILVAAIAPGLAITRGLSNYLATGEEITIYDTRTATGSSGQLRRSPGQVFTATGTPIPRRASYWLGHVPYWAGPCLASLTIAAAGLSWHRRRHDPGRRFDTPGSAAGPAVALALGMQFLREFHFEIAEGRPWAMIWLHHQVSIVHFWIGLPRLAGYTVAVWWLALSLGGRRGGESNSGPRSGQFLGWCWIAMAMASELGIWCYALNF